MAVEGPGLAAAPLSPLLAVPNVTVYPSTVSIPNTVLLYNSPLLCGFNVPIKWLKRAKMSSDSLDYWPEVLDGVFDALALQNMRQN